MAKCEIYGKWRRLARPAIQIYNHHQQHSHHISLPTYIKTRAFLDCQLASFPLPLIFLSRGEVSQFIPSLTIGQRNYHLALSMPTFSTKQGQLIPYDLPGNSEFCPLLCYCYNRRVRVYMDCHLSCSSQQLTYTNSWAHKWANWGWEVDFVSWSDLSQPQQVSRHLYKSISSLFSYGYYGYNCNPHIHTSGPGR